MRFAEQYHERATPHAKILFDDHADPGAWTIVPAPHPDVDAQLCRFLVELQSGHSGGVPSRCDGIVVCAAGTPCHPWSDRRRANESRGLRLSGFFGRPENKLIYDAAWLDASPEARERNYSFFDRPLPRSAVGGTPTPCRPARQGPGNSSCQPGATNELQRRPKTFNNDAANVAAQATRREFIPSRARGRTRNASGDKISSLHELDGRRHRIFLGIQRRGEFPACVPTMAGGAPNEFRNLPRTHAKIDIEDLSLDRASQNSERKSLARAARRSSPSANAPSVMAWPNGTPCLPNPTFNDPRERAILTMGVSAIADAEALFAAPLKSAPSFGGVIPTRSDQNRWAQSRIPMDMMRQGWPTSLFHASRQWCRHRI